MRAYKVIAHEITSIVLSETRNKARMSVFLSANKAGYKTQYKDISAVVAPIFDCLCKPLPCSRQVKPNIPYALDYAMQPCMCAKCVKEGR